VYSIIVGIYADNVVVITNYYHTEFDGQYDVCDDDIKHAIIATCIYTGRSTERCFRTVLSWYDMMRSWNRRTEQSDCSHCISYTSTAFVRNARAKVRDEIIHIKKKVCKPYGLSESFLANQNRMFFSLNIKVNIFLLYEKKKWLCKRFVNNIKRTKRFNSFFFF
jgi:hypothetical protein